MSSPTTDRRNRLHDAHWYCDATPRCCASSNPIQNGEDHPRRWVTAEASRRQSRRSSAPRASRSRSSVATPTGSRPGWCRSLAGGVKAAAFPADLGDPGGGSRDGREGPRRPGSDLGHRVDGVPGSRNAGDILAAKLDAELSSLFDVSIAGFVAVVQAAAAGFEEREGRGPRDPTAGPASSTGRWTPSSCSTGDDGHRRRQRGPSTSWSASSRSGSRPTGSTSRR